MVWASRWSVALRTFYRQILSLLYIFFLLKLPPPARPGTTCNYHIFGKKCFYIHTYISNHPYAYIILFVWERPSLGKEDVDIWPLCQGPSIMLNAHPSLPMRLPSNTPVVLAHGSNDEVNVPPFVWFKKLL